MLTVQVKKFFSGKNQPEFNLDISFEVGNGFTVLMGPSGAGKTSVLRMIAGILKPDEGFIKMNGTVFFDSMEKIDLPIQKRRVGFVFQDYALFPHLTGEQNVAYGVKTGDRKEKLEKARRLLALFRIEHIGKRVSREMSGGERQRVALARALASDPLIVLLDEPLSAVDVETRSRLLDEIESAQMRANIPFIYVTHNETEAERLGNNRITIQNGAILSSV
jgi:ABC-type spermidine/putrescine transport systems, ATPase components